MAQLATKTRKSPREALFKDIVQSLRLLPKMLRRVFVRSHYEGKNVQEIAQELGIPHENVRSMIRDANEIFYRNLHRFHTEH